jgi:N-methylhydantoinase B/oxoprolinase/acetone carboxylase alpha subunit
MTNVIYVKPDKLVTFREDLLKTPIMLENIFSENRNMINKTIRQIDMTADMLNRKKTEARIALESAQADLEAAIAANDEGERKINLGPYISRVTRARERLEKLTDAYDDLMKVRDGYHDSADQYMRDENKYFQDYNTMIKKGGSILGKYTELVRRSTSVIPEG